MQAKHVDRAGSRPPTRAASGDAAYRTKGEASAPAALVISKTGDEEVQDTVGLLR
jgi:hypothetical protein